jgi:hypothetical protein
LECSSKRGTEVWIIGAKSTDEEQIISWLIPKSQWIGADYQKGYWIMLAIKEES